MTPVTSADLISLDNSLGPNPEAVINALAALLTTNGRATDSHALFEDAWKRENQASTVVPGGIAIPHCRSEAVTVPSIAFARLPHTIPFGTQENDPVDLVFFLAAPAGADQTHLTMLSSLARHLVRPDFTAALRSADTPEKVLNLIETALHSDTQPDTSSSSKRTPETHSSAAHKPGRLVAVTACPTGIAHTYMAADRLREAAQQAGVDLEVETQGSSGTKPLAPQVIAAADALIIAADVDVRNRSRFAGKPVVNAPIKQAIDDPDQLLADALRAGQDPHAPRVRVDDPASSSTETLETGLGSRLRRALMTGVSYMIPFVAGGGLLMALGFLLGGYEISTVAKDIATGNNLWNLPTEHLSDLGPLATYLGAVFFSIGSASMGFLVPALAGYIAYGIADRPGIAPGFTAGAVAVLMGAGFIGGLAGGLLAGVAAWWLGSFQTPRWLSGLMPVAITPLCASIVASGLMFLVLGGPIAALTTGLNQWLAEMTGTSAVVLGLILGLMMCFDLGGPVNKVAYSFAVAGLSAGSATNQGPWMVMAAVMAAGMVPPLSMAIATFMSRKQFSTAEQENGKTAILLGFSFISEAAIPFAAADPLRVIPSTMVGGAVTGALSMMWAVTSQAPHGGVFVFFAINPFLLFLLAILIGAFVSALLLITLKRWTKRPQADSPATPTSAAVAAR